MDLWKYLFIFTLSPINCFGQFVETFHEDFIDNSSGWLTGKSSKFEARITDKTYLIDYYHGSHDLHTFIHQYFYAAGNYRIEAEFSLKGDSTAGCGFSFGGDSSLYFHMLLKANGLFAFRKATPNTIENLSGWIQSGAMNTGGRMNKLILNKYPDRMEFELNEKLIYTYTQPAELRGDRLGIYIQPHGIMLVNHIYIHIEERKIKLVKEWNKPMVKRNLGPLINTSYTETTPVISPGGKELYFTRKNDPANLGINNNDDILVSQKQPGGIWGRAARVPSPINNKGHNYVCGVGAGGNSLLLGNVYHPDGSMSKGLSMVTKSKSSWSQPRALRMDNYYNLQSASSNCWSANQKVIILSVCRKDTHGLFDLYASFHIEGDHWTEPLNLGPVINTVGNEQTPFLAGDNATLYFSSDGHPGYGNQDIFVTKRLDSTWTNWSEPKNLGPTLNYSGRDIYFSITASGKYGYYVTDENGQLDIYEVDLEESIRPNATVLVYGVVRDEKTSEPISANITVHDLHTDDETGLVQSNPETGYYEVVLPNGSQYSFYAESKSHYAVREYIDLTNHTTYDERELDLILAPFEIGHPIRLNNIFFEQSEAELLPNSYAELEYLIAILKQNPLMEIRIEGHTDNLGKADANQRLSLRRAESVKNYLISKGIDKRRLTTVGYGGAQPIPTVPSEKRHLNRRVEFTVIK